MREWLLATVLCGSVFCARAFTAESARTSSQRAIEFVETVKVPMHQSAQSVRIWIPTPVEDGHQKTEIVKVDSPLDYSRTREREFGNGLLYFESRSGLKEELEIRVTYRIFKREQRALTRGLTRGLRDNRKDEFLQSRGLESVTPRIQKIADELTEGVSDPLEKARAIYGYVLKNMRYDKSGTGWGQGDPMYACEVGKGNCTDFHSLFIALSRASGIPARFRMGFSLPRESEGKIAGYHCWGEFYIEDRGWIPVDASEAWKEPDRAEYLFGNLDPNRVLLSTGRDISLSPAQNGAPLNYLSKPYVEVDGLPFNGFELERTYKNIPSKGAKKS